MVWILRGVGAFVFLLLCAGISIADPGPDESAAIEKGAVYLTGKQIPVGGWPSEKYGLTSPGHVVAITTLAAHALLAATPGEESLKAAGKALSFIDRLPAAMERGKTHDGYDYASWGVAYALVHLGGIIDRWPTGEKPPDVAGLAARLAALAKARQRPCGGWDYRERPDGSLGVLTAVMLEGLVRWEADGELLERGFVDLASSADKDGLLGYAHDGGYEDVQEGWWSPPEAAGRTLIARWSEVQAGRRRTAALAPCLERLFGAREAYAKARGAADHVKPHDIAGYYYHQAAYYGIRAARELSTADRRARPVLLERASKLIAEMIAGQKEDGSWLDSPAAGETCATSLALLTLAEYREFVVGWAPDPATALRWGKEEGKPVVLLFTEQNEASRKMSGYFYESSFRALLPRVVLCRVDIDLDETMARSARVYRGPTILVADPTVEKPLANSLRKLVGSRKPGKVRDVLATVLGD